MVLDKGGSDDNHNYKCDDNNLQDEHLVPNNWKDSSIDELLFELYKKEAIYQLKSNLSEPMFSANNIDKDSNHSTDTAQVDEFLFKLHKEEKIKQLKARLSACVSNQIKISKHPPAAVAQNLFHDTVGNHSEIDFRSKLEILFGHMMNNEVVNGISEIFNSHCTKMPKEHQPLSEDLVFSILKLFDCVTCHSKAECNDKVCKDAHVMNSDGLDVTKNLLSDGKQVAKRSVGVQKSPNLISDDNPVLNDCGNTSMKRVMNNSSAAVVNKKRALNINTCSAASEPKITNCTNPSLKLPPEHMMQTTSNILDKETLSFISLDEIPVADSVLPDYCQSSPRISAAFNVRPLISPNSDGQFVRQPTFIDKLKIICNRRDKVYSKTDASLKQTHSSSAHVNIERPSCSSLSFVNDGKSSKKAPATDEQECSASNNMFAVTEKERRNYLAVCRLASSYRHSKLEIVDIGGCKIRLFSLGDSFTAGKKVSTYVINCLCRKYFLDERPTVSKKHYFFSSVAAFLLNFREDYSYVERCFTGAGSVLPLHLSEYLFFPTFQGMHWFVFVVDLRNKLFVFLDSIFTKHDNFAVCCRKPMIRNFCRAWGLFVGTEVDFDSFQICYPHVPQHTEVVDSGIYAIKFMELWKYGRKLLDAFSAKDIPNIRIQILNSLLFSQHNKSKIDVVEEYFGPGDFPRISKIVK